MWTHSILPDTLKSFDYYLHKVPMFLRRSESFMEHFKIWFDLLNGGQTEYSGIIPTADCLLYLMNIFDDSYLSFVNSLEDNDSGAVSDILDKFAALFGVSRIFSVTYKNDDDEIVKEQLELNNKDLLTLIKAQIVKNYCNGSAAQIEEFYDAVGLKVFVVTTTSNATAFLQLVDIRGSIEYSDNVKKMFKAGMLRIDSLGISYDDSTAELTGFLEWDAPPASAQGWGRGLWAE